MRLPSFNELPGFGGATLVPNAGIPKEARIQLYKFEDSEARGSKYFVKKRSLDPGGLQSLLASFMEAYALSMINSPYVIRVYGMDVTAIDGTALEKGELREMLGNILALMRKMDSFDDLKDLTRHPCGPFIQLARDFAHKNYSVCLNLEAHFIDNERPLTLKWSNLGHLEDRIRADTDKQNNELFFARILWQTLQAVRHTRKARFYHCDLKPANFLIDGNDNVMLADFDAAQAEEFRPIAAYTEGYLAPEFHNQVVYKATEESEVYSLGKTWEAILRRPADNDKQSSKDKTKEAPPLLEGAMYEGAKPFFGLIDRMTSSRATRRPKLEAIEKDTAFSTHLGRILTQEDSQKRIMPRYRGLQWPPPAEVKCNLWDGCRWCKKNLCCCGFWDGQ